LRRFFLKTTIFWSLPCETTVALAALCPEVNKVSSSIELEGLLSSGSGDGKISATVVAHGKDQKIVVFKKKRRKQYKRTRGHRQGYTELKIDSIG
jgi:hypothetical protein